MKNVTMVPSSGIDLIWEPTLLEFEFWTYLAVDHWHWRLVLCRMFTGGRWGRFPITGAYRHRIDASGKSTGAGKAGLMAGRCCSSGGLGIFIMGAFNGNRQTRSSGFHLMEVGFVLMVIFGSFFELIFSSGHPQRLGQWIAPAALILLGVYLVLARSGLLRKGNRIDPSTTRQRAMRNRYENRSIFWLVLVATGLLWLLVNPGTVRPPICGLYYLYWFILILGLGLAGVPSAACRHADLACGLCSCWRCSCTGSPVE
jgi:hypothetical protein